MLTNRDSVATLATEAYSVVRQRILRGELTLGQAVSRRKLAAELGMSFLPVTEALGRLEFEGLLESRPRAGTRVRIPTREDVEGNYVVREALEVQAAVMISQATTAAERTELRKLAARVDSLSGRPDRTVYLTLHHQFHYRIAEFARCDALCEAIEKTHALASIWLCITQRGSSEGRADRHQRLIEDILGGDSDRAASAVREHLAVGRAYTLRSLAPYFEAQDAKPAKFSRNGGSLAGTVPSVVLAS